MIRVTNLKKPDNKKWKRIADIALYTLPLYNIAIMTMPVPESTKTWILFGINMIIPVFKAITKFTSDEEYNTTVSGDIPTNV